MLKLFAQNNVELTHHITNKNEDSAQIVRQADDSYDAIICMGGDGTLHEVISGVLSRPDVMPIGFVPYGTANDLAYTLGIPKAAKAAGALILQGYSQPVDVGAFNDQRFIYAASFGTFSDVAYLTPQSRKNRLGKLAYVLTGVQKLRGLKTYNATIEHDHGAESGEFALVAVTNARRAGGGFIRYTPDETKLDDGLFELLMVKKPNNFLQMLLVLGKMVVKAQDDQYIRRVQTANVRVKSPTPIPWCMDGEYGGSWHESDVSVIRRCVSLIRARPVPR